MKPFVFERLARALGIEAASGMFAAGDRFLSFRQIRREFRVGKATVRRALELLTTGGVLLVRARSGHTLAPDGVSRARLLLDKLRTPEIGRQAVAAATNTGRGRRKFGLRVAVIVDTEYTTDANLRRGALLGSPQDDAVQFGMRWHHVAFLRGINRHFYEADFYRDDGHASTRRQMLEQIKQRGTSAAAVFRYDADFDRKDLLLGLRAAALPCVTVLDDCERLANASVDFNNEAAGFEAMRILTGLGHRRIAALIPQSPARRFAQRVQGARLFVATEPMAEGTALDEFEMLRGMRPPARLLHRLADRKNRPTAIFFPAISEFPYLEPYLKRAGLRIPAGVSILGCGAHELFERPHPWLDLMRQDFGAIGLAAADILHRLVEGGKPPRTNLIPMPHLPAQSIRRIRTAGGKDPPTSGVRRTTSIERPPAGKFTRAPDAGGSGQ